LIAVAAIPLTVAIVGLALGVVGQTINLMTLAGIAAALGLIADDSIVVIENIESHHARANILRTSDPDRHPDLEQELHDATATGAGELAPALVGSSLSTIVILLPFALLSGVVGAFFKPLALTMALALVISLVIALVVVPVSVGVFHRYRPAPEVPSQTRLKRIGRATGRNLAPIRERLDPMLQRASRGYRRLVDVFVERGSVSVAVVVALLVVAYVLYSRIGTDFLPGNGRGLDHPGLLDASRNIADRDRRDASRGGARHHFQSSRGKLLAPDRRAAWVLHYRAEPW